MGSSAGFTGVRFVYMNRVIQLKRPTQTHRQADRQTHRQTDRKVDRDKQRETDRERDIDTEVTKP